MQKINDRMVQTKNVLLETTPLASVLIDIICSYVKYNTLTEVNIHAGSILFKNNIKTKIKDFDFSTNVRKFCCYSTFPILGTYREIFTTEKFSCDVDLLNKSDFESIHDIVYKNDKCLFFEYYSTSYTDGSTIRKHSEKIFDKESGVHIFKDSHNDAFYGIWIFSTKIKNKTMYVYYKYQPTQFVGIIGQGSLTLPCLGVACVGCYDCDIYRYTRKISVWSEIICSAKSTADKRYRYVCNITISYNLDSLIDSLDKTDKERFYAFQAKLI